MSSKIVLLALFALISCQISIQYSVQKLSTELDDDNLIYETPQTLLRNTGPRFRRETIVAEPALADKAAIQETAAVTTDSDEDLQDGSGQGLTQNELQQEPVKEHAKRWSNEVEGSGQNILPEASGEELSKNQL